jgi:hypothetical protein
MSKPTKDQVSEAVWFLSRWTVGFSIDMAMICGSAYAGGTFFNESLKIGKPWMGLVGGFTLFCGGMAGRVWFRAQYMHRFLKEALETKANSKA